VQLCILVSTLEDVQLNMSSLVRFGRGPEKTKQSNIGSYTQQIEKS